MSSPPPEHRHRSRWPVALVIIALIGGALIAFIFSRIETWPNRAAHQAGAELEHVARGLRDAFVDIGHLQPRITVNNRIYVEQTTPTAELTILTRQLEVEHEMMHTWAGSTKKVKLHGTFAAKAGFDLREQVNVSVSGDEIRVQVPHATILGLEQKQVEVLALENGFWNRISAADVQAEMAMLPELARQRAAESGLAAEAEHALEQQLAARIHTARPIRLVFASEAPKT